MRIKKLLVVMLTLMMALASFPLSAFAAGTTLGDIGIPIDESGLVELKINRKTAQVVKSDIELLSSANTSVNYETLTQNEEYQFNPGDEVVVKYPNALDYFGKKLTVLVTIKCINAGSDVVPTGRTGLRLWSGQVGNIQYESTGAELEWKFEIFDGDKPYNAKGLFFGIADPDESNLYFDNSMSRKLYYIDKEKSDTDTQPHPEMMSEYFHVGLNGLEAYYADGTKKAFDGKSAGGYNSGFIFIDMLNKNSFTINTKSFRNGGANYPFFYAIKTPQRATVKIVDESGNELHKSPVLEGETGEDIIYDDLDAKLSTYLKSGWAIKEDGTTNAQYDADIDTDQELVIVLKQRSEQLAQVRFIDQDSNNMILKTRNVVTGYSGEAIEDAGYTKDLEGYIAKHYVLVKDNMADKPKFDETAGNTQFIDIVLKHDGKGGSALHSGEITRTIHYVFEGREDLNYDKVEKVTYTRTQGSTTDLVTGETTIINDNFKATPEAFTEVKTPAKAGWTYDRAKVYSKTVGKDTKDYEETVVYKPLPQNAKVTIKDVTDNINLKEKTMVGAVDEKLPYNPQDDLQHYLDNGYELVSNNYPTNGKFDSDPNKDQEYVIELRHKQTTYNPSTYKPNTPVNTDPNGTKQPAGIVLKEDVTRTIKYTFLTPGGEQASEDVVEKKNFERTVTIDNVTGEIIKYSNWTSKDNHLNRVETPVIDGWRSSRSVVEARDVKATDPDEVIEIVYIRSEQLASLIITDGTTEMYSRDWSGESESPLGYDPTEKVKTFTDRGYAVSKNDYPTNGNFDSKDDEHQNFVIELTPIIEKITVENAKSPEDVMNPNGEKYPEGLRQEDLSKTVTRTIEYVYEDGTVASEPVVQEVTLTRTAMVNHVTKEITYSEWAQADLEEVQSPVINGYSFDKELVEKAHVTIASEDTKETVTYTPNTQYGKVHFVDEEGNTVLEDVLLEGLTKTPFTTDIEDKLAELTKEKYDLVSNDYNKDDLFDADDANDQEFTVVLKLKELPVHFVDGLTNEVLDDQVVKYGDGATEPEHPEHEGYTFKGWDVEFDSITKETTVTAIYDRILVPVKFLDPMANDKVLSEQEVPYGDPAQEPLRPVHDGYRFVGWDKEFDEVTQELIVKAKYEKVEEPVKTSPMVNTADASSVLLPLSVAMASTVLGLGAFFVKRFNKKKETEE